MKNKLYFLLIQRLLSFLFFLATACGLLASLVYSQENGIVFTSGFEEGNKSIWDDSDPNPDSTNLLIEDPGPFNKEGNHVMRLRVPPGRGGADLVKVLPASYDKLYARWYMMWEPGYDFNARNHGGGLHAGDRNNLGRSNYQPLGNDWFSTWIEPAESKLNLYTYYRGMYMDCSNPQGQCWGDHFPCWFDEGEHFCDKPEHRETIMPPVMENGRWYCIEIMLDAGTPVQSDSEADGVANFWIDGIEYGPFRHLWLRTTSDLKISILWLSLFHHSEHSVEGILLDEVVVSTEKIGCGQPQSIENESIENNYKIIPDYFNKTISVSGISSEISDLKIEIYNILSNRIYLNVLQNTNNIFEISYKDFPSGIYFLKLFSGNSIIIHKLILL